VIRRLLRRRPSTWLLVAGGLAVLAALATLRAAATGPTEPVLVAGRDLSPGTRPMATDLRIAMVPDGGVLTGMLTAPDEVGERMMIAPVREGEPITQAALGGDPTVAPRPLAVAERAVSIPASAAGATIAALVPGARVDVAAPVGVNGDVALAVRDAEVIAVIPAGVDAETQGAILLRVTADEALALSRAGDLGGGVRVIVRPFDERTEVAP